MVTQVFFCRTSKINLTLSGSWYQVSCRHPCHRLWVLSALSLILQREYIPSVLLPHFISSAKAPLPSPHSFPAPPCCAATCTRSSRMNSIIINHTPLIWAFPFITPQFKDTHPCVYVCVCHRSQKCEIEFSRMHLKHSELWTLMCVCMRANSMLSLAQVL